MMRRSIVGLALATASIGDACAPSCRTLQGHGGIVLSIRDARTGASLNDAATVTIERLSAPNESRTGLAWEAASITVERQGLYRVRISSNGYQSWSRDVRVPSAQEACNAGGPMAVALTASLVPAN
jgi:hypothetical protein